MTAFGNCMRSNWSCILVAIDLLEKQFPLSRYAPIGGVGVERTAKLSTPFQNYFKPFLEDH